MRKPTKPPDPASEQQQREWLKSCGWGTDDLFRWVDPVTQEKFYMYTDAVILQQQREIDKLRSERDGLLNQLEEAKGQPHCQKCGRDGYGHTMRLYCDECVEKIWTKQEAQIMNVLGEIAKQNSDSFLCECSNWARIGDVFLTKHHPNCDKYDFKEETRKIINDLLDGILVWAGDEDWVHDECFGAFERAAWFVGRPEIIKEDNP
jgi:hypothetical protein